MSDATRTTLDPPRLLNASPQDYWDGIVAKVQRACDNGHHAALLNHEAAHVLAWANIARDAARANADTSAPASAKHAPDCQSHIVDTRGRPDECTCGADASGAGTSEAEEAGR